MEYFPPTLCNEYDPEKALFPCVTQPKLDGMRCLHSVSDSWSRGLKPQKEYIREWLVEHTPNLPENVVLDGELMLPQERFDFQDTISAVKKKNENFHLIQYHVYDIRVMDAPEMPFWERRQLIPGLTNGKQIVGVETMEALDNDQVQGNLKRYLEMGYEGLIYRNTAAPYNCGRSGRDLLKLKPFYDAEYIIVGVEEGKGKFVGMPVYVCDVGNGKTFRVVPEGSFEHKRQLWEDRETCIGKMLTVKYQELSKDNVPRFPVGICTRDYEG